MREQDMVQEFHDKTGSDITDVAETSLVDYPLKMLGLRANLIEEEHAEVMDEFEMGTYTSELIKELCDLLYVIYGTGVALGVDLHDAFKVVHQSNMSKIPSNGDEILYRGDGKVQKPIGYVPVDMESEIQRQRVRSQLRKVALQGLTRRG